MALALGWTLRQVMEHSPHELEAMLKALETRNRSQRMAAAHKAAR